MRRSLIKVTFQLIEKQNSNLANFCGKANQNIFFISDCLGCDNVKVFGFLIEIFHFQFPNESRRQIVTKDVLLLRA